MGWKPKGNDGGGRYQTMWQLRYMYPRKIHRCFKCSGMALVPLEINMNLSETVSPDVDRLVHIFGAISRHANRSRHISKCPV